MFYACFDTAAEQRHQASLSYSFLHLVYIASVCARKLLLCMDMLLLFQDEDIVSEESLRKVCQKVGLSGELTDNLIGQIRTDRIKEELKRTTQEALDLGVSCPPRECGNSFVPRPSPLKRKRVG